MSKHGTAIEWTQAPGYKGETWNPVTGCDRVSPGCAHCYALELAERLKGMGQKRYQRDGDPKTSGPGFGLTLHPDKLDEPLRWTKPRMVFVNSMSDLFHEEIPDEYIRRVFGVMAAAADEHGHVFQVLTKRAERMAALLKAHWWPHPNVWLGVSIENRRFVHRADLLRQTPAAVRFISAEPLLGPLVPNWWDDEAEHDDDPPEPHWPDGKPVDHTNPALDLTGIDWLIAGGESGPRHRRIEAAWVESLRDACLYTGDLCAACAGGGFAPDSVGHWSSDPCSVCDGSGHLGGTRFFFKQWGGHRPKSNGRELAGRTWDEFPRLTTLDAHRGR